MSNGTTIAPREPRERDAKYLAFLRTKPCVACGKPGPSDPAHIRMSSARYGKRSTGMAEKPHDRWAISLCRRCHRKQHSVNEREFWRALDKNPFEIAIELYRLGGTWQPNETPRRRRRVSQSRPIQNRGFPIALPQHSATKPVTRRATGDV